MRSSGNTLKPERVASFGARPPLSLSDRLQGAAIRGLSRLPAPAQRLLAGGPAPTVDGLTLHHEPHLVIALAKRANRPPIEELPVSDAREETVQRALATRGAMEPVARVEDLGVPGPAGLMNARFYVPQDAGDGLLVYFHGGGFVIGDLVTCESVCRFLACHAGVRVLAVDYRMGPEHLFPAAVEDTTAALEWARENAARLEADPTRIAVGGDSAGGNLATVAARLSKAANFQLLIYPVCDFSEKRPSYASFREGFLLSETEMDWFRDRYLPGESARSDPRASPLLADDLSVLPPAYVVTAGFDPLRDEGEAYAQRMREAGVRVALRRHDGLVHSFANWTNLGRASRDAMLEAAGALRQGLA